MSRYFIYIGLFFILIGLTWPWLSKIPFGKLPGDLVLKGENYSFYFPLATSIILSVILSLILWIIRK